ncbi:MAG: S10 family peptidase [bacterium]|nr:S10 family peptidase [bacterium]
MKRIILFLVLLLVFTGVQTLVLHGQVKANQSLQDKAGFIVIDPVQFSFNFGSYFHRLPMESDTARLWYSFQAAEIDPQSKPLFVFFNGGPGSGTSEGLMSLNTGKKTYCFDPESGECTYRSNPESWAQMGNLLYVDARQTGFSYSLSERHQSPEQRYLAFGGQNHNCFFDAADFIRLLLTFLSEHPSIRNNRIIIVGESYGGVRTIAMLHMLLNYKDYGNGKAIYRDEALAEMIQGHYDNVFPQYSGSEVPAEVIANQFTHQVLIQPAITMNYQNSVAGQMWEQPGSDIYKIAAEEGATFEPCQNDECDSRSNGLNFVRSLNRDIYAFSKPFDWMSSIFDAAEDSLRYTDNLSTLLGYDVKQIQYMYASARATAFKVVFGSDAAFTGPGMDPSVLPLTERWKNEQWMRSQSKLISEGGGDMEEVFGTLNSWDLYFIGSNRRVQIAFYTNVAIQMGYNIDPYSELFGDMFLENVAHVKTFVTNAAEDLVIYAKSIPPALAMHTNILNSAIHNEAPVGNEERGGRIILNYKADAFPHIPNLNTRTIRFPIYSTSCHCVPITQPLDFFNDVYTWLNE